VVLACLLVGEDLPSFGLLIFLEHIVIFCLKIQADFRMCFLPPLLLWEQGVLGIKVKIMLDWDPKGKVGPTTPLPDVVIIHTPKEEEYAPTVEVITPLEEIPVA
jgi:hypothetical protein